MVTEARPAGGDTAEPQPDPRFTVLVADDDRGTREALGEVLADRGFRPLLAADGGEAVEIVRVELIHLVLFDMHMPRLTGLEALALLRQTLPRLLPAVLMTADANTDLLRQAFQARVYSVIPKPVNTNIVLHTLAGALAKEYGTPPRPPRPDELNPAGADPRPTDGR
ncbi:MAG: response regulator [Gemmataceae bacterium]|nr:response regulator [Gemmataceae bacterium]